MATYAIGDIQGCYTAFQCLLEQIQFDKNEDKLWVAGDLVNRGEQNVEVLRFLKSLGKRAEVVLGNHDLHLLAVAHHCSRIKEKDTIQDILNAEDKQELLYWLRSRPLIYSETIGDTNYVMSHAGIPPIWNLEQALAFGNEVHEVLSGFDFQDFLKVMYGNQPDTWFDSIKGQDRNRLITNYLTRMRFCDSRGKLELYAKKSPDDAPPGFQPWFQIANEKLNETEIIFGHWAALQGTSGNNRYHAIDTGCVWGNKLTALRLEDKERFTCDCP